MTCRHNDVAFYLGHLLQLQLDRDLYRLRVNASQVQRADETYYIPDIVVLPTAMTLPLLDRDDLLEAYTDPLPLVVEVWSPSTGGYDVDSKIPEYRARADREIWRVHPFERTVMVWRRQPDGSYEETLYREGTGDVASLPGVAIELDALWR